jgi:integrase
MIYLRGRTWYTDVQNPQGDRVRISTGTNDKAQALVFAARVAAGDRPANNASPTGTAHHTMADALQQAWTDVWVNRKAAAGFRTLIREVEAYMGSTPVKDVDHGALTRFRRHLTDKGLSEATANRYLACASKALTTAAKMGWIQARPPIPKGREGRGRPLYLTADQVSDIVAREDDPLLRTGWLLFTQSGLRPAEALALTWDDVDLADRWLRVGNAWGDTKSSQFRTVPISKRLATALAEVKAEGHSAPLGGRGYVWWSKRWKQACDRIGVILPKGTSIYVARHTTATLMVAAGLDVTEVQRILGHATVTTTQVYVKTLPMRLKSAVEQLFD